VKIAVIIPLYNGASWIRITLNAVLRQSVPADEIVVVDDGSTDGAPDIVREFPKVRLLTNPKKGANFARQFGCEATSAPYVAFLDQDDLWHPHHLRHLSRWLDSQPACRAVSSSECDLSRRIPKPAWDLSDMTRSRNDAWRHFPFGPRVGTPSAVLMRRECLEEIGGWNAEFPGMADYYTWLGLSANGTPQGGMAICKGVTMARRRHQHSYSAALRTGEALVTYSDTLRRASLAAAERFGARSSLPPETLALRVHAANDLHEIVSAFCRQDWDAYAQAARAGWDSLREESENVRRKFCGMTCWFLDGRRTLKEALRLFDQAIAHWPEEDTYTRELMLNRRNSYLAARPSPVVPPS
jgi:glycosyltransferase involved in cell wall biosynthesis